MYNNVLVKANDNHIKTVLLQGTPVAKEYILLVSNPCTTSMSKMKNNTLSNMVNKKINCFIVLSFILLCFKFYIFNQIMRLRGVMTVKVSW